MVRLDMADADVRYLDKFQTPLPSSHIRDKLLRDTPWSHEEVVVWGKRHLQPRLTAWYGDKGKHYSYSGASMSPMPWTHLLLALKYEVESFAQTEFNSVLLNLYRNQDDRMGFHSDNEPSLGTDPVIVSLSYGATRVLIFKHKNDKSQKIKHLNLKDSSLLLMSGETQKNWVHGINKHPDPCGARINLTFRNIVK